MFPFPKLTGYSIIFIWRKLLLVIQCSLDRVADSQANQKLNEIFITYLPKELNAIANLYDRICIYSNYLYIRCTHLKI